MVLCGCQYWITILYSKVSTWMSCSQGWKKTRGLLHFCELSVLNIVTIMYIYPLLPLQNKMTGRSKTYVFNHVQFTLWFHRGTAKDGRIVRALVTLASCDSTPCLTSSNAVALPQPDKKDGTFTIKYSYSVYFKVILLSLSVYGRGSVGQ